AAAARQTLRRQKTGPTLIVARSCVHAVDSAPPTCTRTTGKTMTTSIETSNISAPTRLLDVANQTYAYRRFGNASAQPPLLCLQHFTGTLDNWDPAVTDPLASTRDVILFDNAGVGRCTGWVPQTVRALARHAR